MIRKVNIWEESLIKKEFSKTKLMVGGGRYNRKKTVGEWPCAVCDEDVGTNSTLCTNCQ